MILINLTDRQNKIIEIVKENDPITSKEIAEKLDLTRGALRSDLSILTMANILKAKPRVGYFYSEDNSYLRNFDDIYSKKVKEIKATPVVINENTSVYEAVVTLFLEDTGSLFVVEEKEELIGVVSRKDLLKITMGETNIKEVPISIAMTRMPHLVTIEDDDTLFDAAKKLVDYEIDSLPVVENLGTEENDNLTNVKIIGVVDKTTINRIFVDFGLEL